MSGIFCLEGDWSNNLTDKSSVKPVLDLLENVNGTNVIHRNVGTKEELSYYSSKWIQKKYDKFQVGYFAFHGEPGTLKLGGASVAIEEIGELLEGKCAGKIIYFGSCSVLSIPEDRLNEFKKITKAKSVCGYNKDVDWIMSSAFDLLLFDALSYYNFSPSRSLNYLKKNAPGLIVNLDFVMY